MVGGTNLPPPPVPATIQTTVSFQQMALKLGNFTDFKAFFSAMLKDFR